MSFVQNVPDIAKEQLKAVDSIDLVGIKDLKIPVRLTSKLSIPANLSILVSLKDKKVRGIHMSRMYLGLHDYFSKNIVQFSGLKKVLTQVIKDQGGISESGRIQLKSNWPVLRKALKSSIQGWREYPFYFEVNYSKKEKTFNYTVGGEVLYSSTCPCSASLSRQIIKKGFEKTFSKKKQLKKEQVLNWLSDKKFLSATPHAQKSAVFFKLKLKEKIKDTFSLLKVIDDIEKVLGTPVQTFVKREDEAEFAKLNAKNLMFCEDAVRRVASLLKKKQNLSDYFIRVQHYESLHPFTVESSIAKGVKGGWRA